MTALRDDYAGAFDPDGYLTRLSRAGLARLGREVMLLSMLHDRALMPHVAGRGGTRASIELADDEWMASSPIYTTRNRANLGITGDSAGDVLKAFQFDIGAPHHFLDAHGEVVDHDHGWFWLSYCGAHDYVRWVSGNDPGIVTMMCHHMEDNTFDATLKVTNPRARFVPVHRPPKPDEFTGDHCRWEVRILDEDVPARPDNPNLEVLWGTAAAGFGFALGEDGEPGGLADYAGDYIPGLRLEDLAHGVLVRQVKEFALDLHLLMRAAYLSVAQRHGPDVLATAGPEHVAALAPPMVGRLTAALGITGGGPEALAKVLQVNPLLPPDYVALRVGLDGDEVTVAVDDCEALGDRAVPSPLDQLDDERPALLAAVAEAVDPRAVVTRVGDHRWVVRIDPDAEPAAPHPMAEIVGGHNYGPADLTAREVPVALRR